MLITALALISAHAVQNRASLSPARAVQIDRYIAAEMKREGIPGMEIGVFRDGHSIFSKGYGVANVELGVPVTPATPMQTGSVGKQFTATAVMMLVEQGKVHLGDSVTKYFPELPVDWKQITVANLLSHTSGVADYMSVLTFDTTGALDIRLEYSDADLVRAIGKLPLHFAVGTSWEYSNSNYLLLGLLIKRVAGQSRIDFTRQHIFAPLGMTRARGLSNTEIIPGRAAGYVMVGGRLTNQPFVSDTFQATGDGGLYLSLNDFEKWDRSLYGSAILSQATLTRMETPFLLNDGQPNSGKYGFGWERTVANGHALVEHSGMISGFCAVISRYVDDRLTIVAMANLDAEHADIVPIERVVAGLVMPALMPQPLTPIADDDPLIGRAWIEIMRRMLHGEDANQYFAPDSGYRFNPADGPDMVKLLPRRWQPDSLRLLTRLREDGKISSTYRIGPPGDTRVIWIYCRTDGKIENYRIVPDPDLH